MRVLFDSYDKVMQNPAGGVQTRIKYLAQELAPYCEVKLFDKWNDKFADYDILHVFKIGVDRYEIIKAAKAQGLKIVVSTVLPDEFNNLHSCISRMIAKLPIMTGYNFLKYALKNSDLLLPQSSKEKDNLIKVFGIDENRIKVMPNGCSLDFSKPIDKSFVKTYNIKKPYALCVGRIDENKNQLNLIEALRNTNIELYIIGGPDFQDDSYYKQCISKATSNIHFIGWLKQNENMLLSAYQNAKVTVLPSHNEIFGNTLVEGACAGTNLASTKTLTTIGDYDLKDHMSVFNPSNIKEIYDAVAFEYYKEKNLSQGEYFRNIFSWKKISEEHFDLYSNLMGDTD